MSYHCRIPLDESPRPNARVFQMEWLSLLWFYVDDWWYQISRNWVSVSVKREGSIVFSIFIPGGGFVVILYAMREAQKHPRLRMPVGGPK